MKPPISVVLCTYNHGKYIEPPEATIPAYSRHLYFFAILLKETIDFTYFISVKFTVCQKG